MKDLTSRNNIVIEQGDPILIAGASGMVGSALVRTFSAKGYSKLLTPSRQELDFSRQGAVEAYIKEMHPKAIFIAAARVGGIYANSHYPAEFIYQNLIIAANVIHAAHLYNVPRVVFLGSTCIYPRMAPQPIKEESLLSGPLELTNEAYAIAKIAGVKLCQFYNEQYGRNYTALMPCNLYGPGDNYHPENAHVLPALLRRFHEAVVNKSSEVVVWGTGRALREFLFVDDLAEACACVLNKSGVPTLLNVGSSQELSIAELACTIAAILDYKGGITFDPTKPDGTPRKKADATKIQHLGWRATTSLREGIKVSYQDFLERMAFERN